MNGYLKATVLVVPLISLNFCLDKNKEKQIKIIVMDNQVTVDGAVLL
jgi:hypothetical protein